MPSKYRWTEKKIAAYYAEGRGQGRGPEYLPWLQVHDVPSNGLSHRVFSRTCQRPCHLLSNIEYDFFVWLEWNRAVVDIREQFPLDRELTRTYAEALGFRHPRQPGEQIDIVMTVDFLVDLVVDGKSVIKAFAVKNEDEINNRRSMQKLDIAGAVLTSLGIEQHLVLNTKLPKLSIRNIKSIYLSEERGTEDAEESAFLAEAKPRLLRSLVSATPKTTLSIHCENHDLANGYLPGTSIRLAKLLMIDRSIVAPLQLESMLDCSIKLLLKGAI